MKNIAAPLLLLLPLTACEKSQEMAQNQAQPDNAIAAINSQPKIDRALGPSDLPEQRDMVEEVPIDPGSGQSAGQVLQRYVALLEQRRLTEARQLWAERGAGSGLSQEGFEENYSKYSKIHAEIGTPGRVEGAAGSAYVEIPVRFYGKLKGGRPFNSAGTATLRRVNDVPGSTAEQRRWHIYRIDVQPPL